jgi:hypothetical protein
MAYQPYFLPDISWQVSSTPFHDFSSRITSTFTPTCSSRSVKSRMLQLPASPCPPGEPVIR